MLFRSEFVVISVLTVIVFLPIGLTLVVVRRSQTRKLLLAAMVGAIPCLIGGVALGFWFVPLDLSTRPHGPFWGGKLIGGIVGGIAAAIFGALLGISIAWKKSR